MPCIVYPRDICGPEEGLISLAMAGNSPGVPHDVMSLTETANLAGMGPTARNRVCHDVGSAPGKRRNSAHGPP